LAEIINAGMRNRKIFSKEIIILPVFLIILTHFSVFADCQFEEYSCKTKNIILVTLDGFRWQEVFRGADRRLLKVKKYNPGKNKTIEVFWDPDKDVCRKKLMPFLWSEINSRGAIYGNRDMGCKVNTANKYWFSYPGYHEILSGNIDIRINSNSLGPNPCTTILEHLNLMSQYKGKVAVFSSWSAFSDIVNENRSGIFVNGGLKRIPTDLVSPVQAEIEKMYSLLPEVFSNVRFDAFTFEQAFEHLKNHNPRVLMIALAETDEFGHHGRYDLYLQAASRTDHFISELWDWIQDEPGYKDKTTLIITTDHGRGTGRNGWKKHGRHIRHSNETWIAMIGPDTQALGEIRTKGNYYNAQVASTIASKLNVRYSGNNPRYNRITDRYNFYKDNKTISSVQDQPLKFNNRIGLLAE
jgi:hypothetical protein